MKIKIKEVKPKYYDLTLRYSIKSFDRVKKDHNKYKRLLAKKLGRSLSNFFGPFETRGRMSIFIKQVSEEEMKRICNKAKLIEDGIFREVLIYISPN